MGQNSKSLKQNSLLLGRAAAFIVALFASAYFNAGIPSGLPVDDAYIHLCYARNLAQGNGLCFNPGEPSLGFTSPLWVFLLALGARAGLPESWPRLLGFLSLALSAVMLHDLVLRSLEARARSLGKGWLAFFPAGAAALFALSGNMLWISFSGMESVMFLALGLLALWSLKQGQATLLTGTALGLLMLTRVTGVVLFAVILIYYLIKERTFKTRFIIPFLPAFIITAPWYIYTWVRFDTFMPNTGKGKLASNLFNSGHNFTGEYRYFLRHLGYVWNWNTEMLIMMIVALMGLAFIIAIIINQDKAQKEDDKNSPAVMLLLFWAVFHLCLHAVSFRSTYILTPYHNMRYQVPLFALVPAGFALTLAYLANYLIERKSRFTAKPAAALLIMLLLVSAYMLPFWKNVYMKNIEHLKVVHRAAALYAERNLPENARLACFDIGSLRFFSKRYIIDLGGLIDPDIHPYLERQATGPYLIRQRATHYIKMTMHEDERLTGVEKGEGVLYELTPYEPCARFYMAPYISPSFLHSRGMEIFRLSPIKPGHKSLD